MNFFCDEADLLLELLENERVIAPHLGTVVVIELALNVAKLAERLGAKEHEAVLQVDIDFRVLRVVDERLRKGLHPEIKSDRRENDAPTTNHHEDASFFTFNFMLPPIPESCVNFIPPAIIPFMEDMLKQYLRNFFTFGEFITLTARCESIITMDFPMGCEGRRIEFLLKTTGITNDNFVKFWKVKGFAIMDRSLKWKFFLRQQRVFANPLNTWNTGFRNKIKEHIYLHLLRKAWLEVTRKHVPIISVKHTVHTLNYTDKAIIKHIFGFLY